MEWLASNDPIIACSTGTAQSTAISLIRISGLENLNSIQSFFSRDLSKVEARKAYLSKLLSKEKVLDEVVFTYFEGPNSFNGENILEISAHGNPLIVRGIIDAFKESGIRDAGPGEMSYRALRNNKLTMTQVEGLDTLLNSNSKELIDQGLSNLGGSLQKEFLHLKDLYLNLRGSIEILIDFSEDVGEEESLANFHKFFNEFKEFVFTLRERTRSPRSHLLKPKVVLLGNTNAGKSTIFNKFLNEDRAIVSDIKGTTRDYISEFFYYSGTEFQIVDTAGIRESEDQIEVAGIKLSKKLYSEAFCRILVINPFLEEDVALGELTPDILIFTHSDQEGFQEKLNKYEELTKSGSCFHTGSIGPESSGPIEPLTEIKNLISNKYKGLTSLNPILPERQRSNISDLYALTDQINQLISFESDPAILSGEINRLDQQINSLLGITTPDDVLNNIFSNFCIGK